MQKYWNTVQDQKGNPREGASVAVQQSSVNSTIYADQAGATPKTNPLTTDTRGYFEFYAAAGEYDLVVSGTGFDTYTITDGAIVGLPSDDVTFLQSGSGATARSAQDKLRDWVSVKDFGALGDGSTDDAAAIQAAIDAVTASGSYDGRTVYFPKGKYMVGTTISIGGAADAGLRLVGEKMPVAPGSLATGYPGAIHWDGAANGVVFTLTDPLHLEFSHLEIRGADTAANAFHINQSQGGWGLCTFNHIALDRFTRAPIRFAGTAAIDGGQNRFFKCAIWNRHTATGTAEYDCCVAYENVGNVQDVYDQCAFIYSDGSNKVASTYAIYFKANNPQTYFDKCFTHSTKGIYVAAGGPYLRIDNHYSEDTEFLTGAAAVTSPVVLRNVIHGTTTGGHSISWVGPSTTAIPFIIDGGWYPQSVAVSGRGLFIIQNSPRFDGTLTYNDKADVIRIGRDGNYSNESVGVINASSFIPHIDAARTSTSNSTTWAADFGTVIPVTLTENTTIANPARVDTTWDVGKEVEFQIVGHASNTYTVAWGTAFTLAGGAYTHSGAGKTDIIAFRYTKIDSGNAEWVEIRRSMDLTSW